MRPKQILKASLRLFGGPGSEKVAMATAVAVGRLAGLKECRLADVQTAVSEACLNAIEHGNRNQSDTPVYLTFHKQAKSLKVIVRDCGTGFHPAALRKPDLDHQLSEITGKRGWGFFFMENLADRVRVRSGRRGCAVELYFSLKDEVEK